MIFQTFTSTEILDHMISFCHREKGTVNQFERYDVNLIMSKQTQIRNQRDKITEKAGTKPSLQESQNREKKQEKTTMKKHCIKGKHLKNIILRA